MQYKKQMSPPNPPRGGGLYYGNFFGEYLALIQKPPLWGRLEGCYKQKSPAIARLSEYVLYQLLGNVQYFFNCFNYTFWVRQVLLNKSRRVWQRNIAAHDT